METICDASVMDHSYEHMINVIKQMTYKWLVALKTVTFNITGLNWSRNEWRVAFLFRFDVHRLKQTSSRERRFIWFLRWVYSQPCTEPLFLISFWQVRRSKTGDKFMNKLITTIESSMFNHALKGFFLNLLHCVICECSHSDIPKSLIKIKRVWLKYLFIMLDAHLRLNVFNV